MATESKDDPVSEFKAFKVGSTIKDTELQAVMGERFDHRYRLAVFGPLGAGKSSCIKTVLHDDTVHIPIAEATHSVTLSAFLYEVSEGVEILDTPGVDSAVMKTFKSDRFESLQMRQASGDDAKAAEQYKQQLCVRRVLKLLRDGCVPVGTPVSWIQGAVLNEETMEPILSPPPSPDQQIHSALVMVTLKDLAKHLTVSGGTPDKFSIKEEDEYGNPSELAQFTKMAFNLVQAAQTLLKVPCTVLVTGLDVLMEHVTPDVDRLVEEAPASRLRLLTKERAKFLMDWISKRIMGPESVFFVDLSNPSTEGAQRGVSEALLHALRSADRIAAQTTRRNMRRLKMGAGSGSA